MRDNSNRRTIRDIYSTSTIPVRCYGLTKYMFQENEVLLCYIVLHNPHSFESQCAKSTMRKKQSKDDGPPPTESFIGV